MADAYSSYTGLEASLRAQGQPSMRFASPQHLMYSPSHAEEHGGFHSPSYADGMMGYGDPMLQLVNPSSTHGSQGQQENLSPMMDTIQQTVEGYRRRELEARQWEQLQRQELVDAQMRHQMEMQVFQEKMNRELQEVQARQKEFVQRMEVHEREMGQAFEKRQEEATYAQLETERQNRDLLEHVRQLEVTSGRQSPIMEQGRPASTPKPISRKTATFRPDGVGRGRHFSSQTSAKEVAEGMFADADSDLEVQVDPKMNNVVRAIKKYQEQHPPPNHFGNANVPKAGSASTTKPDTQPIPCVAQNIDGAPRAGPS